MLLITIIRKFISDVWKSIKRKWQYIRNYYHYFLYGIKNQKIHIFTLVVNFILFVTGIIAYFEEPSENNIILFLCALFNFFWSFYGLIKEPVEYIKPEFYMEKKIEKEGTLVEKEKVLKNEEFKNHNRKYKLNCNLVQQIRKKSSKKIDMQSQKHKTESQCISTQNISSNYQDEYMFSTPCNELASNSPTQCKYIRENPLSWCIEKKENKY